jgi:hypothetical protein
MVKRYALVQTLGLGVEDLILLNPIVIQSLQGQGFFHLNQVVDPTQPPFGSRVASNQLTLD